MADVKQQDPAARRLAVGFAIAAGLLMLLEAGFTALIGLWLTALPCSPGGSGSCTAMGYATAASLLVIIASPIALCSHVRRAVTVTRAGVVGVLGVAVPPGLTS